MADDPLHSLVRGAEGRSFCFTFEDGGEILAEVVSSSHVDADDTVVIVRAGAPPTEPGYNIRLADIRSVTTPDGRVMYQRA
jgi:hypothetical protein